MDRTYRQFSTSISTSLVSFAAAFAVSVVSTAADLSLKTTNDYVYTEYELAYPDYLKGLGIGSSFDYKAIRLEDFLFLNEAGAERISNVSYTNRQHWSFVYTPSIMTVYEALDNILYAISQSIIIAEDTVTRHQPYKTDLDPSRLTFLPSSNVRKYMFPSNEMPGTNGFNYPMTPDGFVGLLFTNNVPLATNLFYYGYQNLAKGTRFTHVAEPTFVTNTISTVIRKEKGSTAEVIDGSIILKEYDEPVSRRQDALTSVKAFTLRRTSYYSKISAAHFDRDSAGHRVFVGISHTWGYDQESTIPETEKAEERVHLTGRKIKGMQFFAVARFTSNLRTVDYDGSRFDRINRDEVWLVPIQSYAEYGKDEKFIYEIDYKALLDLLLDGDKDPDDSIGAFVSFPQDPPPIYPNENRRNYASYDVAVTVLGVTGLAEIEWHARELEKGE